MSWFVLPSACYFFKIQSICLSKASVSRDKCYSFWGIATTGTDTRFYCSIAGAPCTSCIVLSNVLSSAYFSFLIRVAALSAKLQTNRWFSLDNLRNAFDSVRDWGAFKLWNASVSWSAHKFPCCTTYSRWSILSMKYFNWLWYDDTKFL